MFLDGWFKVQSASKSKHRAYKPSIGLFTLRHLNFWNYFQRIFRSWKVKRLVVIFVMSSCLTFLFICQKTGPKLIKKIGKQLKSGAKRKPLPFSCIALSEKNDTFSFNIRHLNNIKLAAAYYKEKKTPIRRKNLLCLVSGSKYQHCLTRNFSNLLQHLTRSVKERMQGPMSKCFQPILRKNCESYATFSEQN